MKEGTEEIFDLLTGQVMTRYRRSRRRTMLDVYKIDPLFLEVDAEFLEFVLSNRAEVATVLADPEKRERLARIFVEETLRYSYENNQFIHFDAMEKKIFESIYRVYIDAIRNAVETSPDLEGLKTSMSTVISDHFQRLRANITRFFDPQAVYNIRENLVFQKAVCSEYSPEFQLKLMGVDPGSLLGPVLDIGCGQSGNLVKYLNSIGLKAHGADRLVDADPLLTAGDWFDLPLEPESWGTIISHMAFSNHFLFHHHYRNGEPDRFARLYLKILESLKPGGSFIYSPGLPFIERFLPAEKYRIRRSRSRATLSDGVRSAGSGHNDHLYTTRVERR